MDSPNSIRNSCSFQAKKWTLFSFCAIGIVTTIIMAALANKLTDTYIQNEISNQYTEQEKESIKQTAIVLIWIISVFTILIDLMGLMGAYKEHYCMTVTYAVLMTIGALGSIGSASRNHYYWSTVVISILICVVSYSYAYDLRRIRIQRFATPMGVIITGQTNAPFVQTGTVYQPTGQSYVVGPQFSGQYGQPNVGQVATPYPPAYNAYDEQKTNY